MRHIIYFSNSAVTSGKALSDGNLMKAGRMDIAIHSFIQGVFLSHGFRDDVNFHFIFYGMPDPPKHIEIRVTPELEISKKDVGNLIKKILYKYKAGEKTEVLPGCFIEKKSFLRVIKHSISLSSKSSITRKKLFFSMKHPGKTSVFSPALYLYNIFLIRFPTSFFDISSSGVTLISICFGGSGIP